MRPAQEAEPPRPHEPLLPTSYIESEMPDPDLAIVTGACSYTGRYVARRLLDQGVRVGTLTCSPDA